MADKLRIVCMGTPEFAVPTLKALNKHHNLVGVITAPDRPAGRGHKLKPSAMKLAAQEMGSTLLQPTNLKDPEFQSVLKRLKADVFIVVAFRMLPKSVWNMPPMGTINLHASLLPQYRGAAPINRAIMNGEEKSGLTTFFIQEEIDTGGILLQKEMHIGPDENAGSLHDRMMEDGAELLIKTLEKLQEGSLKAKDQSEYDLGDLKPAPKLFKPDFYLKPSWGITKIYNTIRGLSPYPGAILSLKDPEGRAVDLRIYKAMKIDGAQSTDVHGLVREGLRLFLAAKDGRIELLEIQIPGKKRMETQTVLNGTDLNSGWNWVEKEG